VSRVGWFGKKGGSRGSVGLAGALHGVWLSRKRS